MDVTQTELEQPDEALNEIDIAQTPLEQPDIVGGRVARVGAWPWMAYLEIGRSSCGGSLIHRKWILTAAHCVYDQNGRRVDKSAIFAILGRHRVTPNSGTRIGVKQVIVHSSYRNNSNARTHDIALLELSRSSSYQTMPMLDHPAASLVRVNQQATVTGWGGIDPLDRENTRQSNVLKQLTLPIVSANRCGVNSSLELCVSYVRNSQASCYGDSGGPLVVYNPQSKRWTQVGVVSKGSVRCANGYSIYTRVSFFRNWIISKINASTTPIITNLARGRGASASSQWNSNYRSSYGSDGRNNTRWSSNRTSGASWYVDLGQTRTFNQVKIKWQGSYARQYRIVWYVNGNWYGKNYSVSRAGTYNHNIGRRNARFVGVFLDRRAPGKNNYSFWEFEVYNHSAARRSTSEDNEQFLEDDQEVRQLSIEEIPTGLSVDESYRVWLPIISR